MAKEKMSIELLDSVEKELIRFHEKLSEARIRIINETNKDGRCLWPVSTKETAAVRRSALDLKNELTRITQSISY